VHGVVNPAWVSSALWVNRTQASIILTSLFTGCTFDAFLVDPFDQCSKIELRGPNLSVGTRYPPFAAVWLIYCALATWSYESGVTADRGPGALSQLLKPSGGLQKEADLSLR